MFLNFKHTHWHSIENKTRVGHVTHETHETHETNTNQFLDLKNPHLEYKNMKIGQDMPKTLKTSFIQKTEKCDF